MRAPPQSVPIMCGTEVSHPDASREHRGDHFERRLEVLPTKNDLWKTANNSSSSANIIDRRRSSSRTMFPRPARILLTWRLKMR
jgi:hypothetical protein